MYAIFDEHTIKLRKINKKYDFSKFVANYEVKTENLRSFVGNIDDREYITLITYATKYYYTEEKRCKAFLNVFKFLKIRKYLSYQDVDPIGFLEYQNALASDDVKKYFHILCN